MVVTPSPERRVYVRLADVPLHIRERHAILLQRRARDAHERAALRLAAVYPSTDVGLWVDEDAADHVLRG